MIDEAGCDKIDAAGVKFIKAYSVMTCSSKKGVCATCYGRDLSRGKMVHVGEAIGMILAQSIGEPGTQLTMRTFHVGGTASVKQDSQIISKNPGTLKIINSNILEDSKKNLIVIEDCAQAIGATYSGRAAGSLGSVGCFSFYPTKNMTTGEGGITLYKDSELAELGKKYINHGRVDQYLHDVLGFNSAVIHLLAFPLS